MPERHSGIDVDMISSFRRNPPSAAAAAVILFAVAVFFTDLGETSLPSQDDAYQAQVTKEMMERGDFIGITYGG
jgi:4-amino-4-deoxy-L-arabinose transferase-like glycosyltransferase